MKKLICTIMAVMMIISCSSALAASFVDMPDNWATEALTKAVDNNLLTGYDDNTIRPNDNVTRAQMATIMVRAFGATKEADISAFSDVNSTDWYYSYMAISVEMGLFKGDGENLNPTKNITRQEAFLVLARAFDLKDGESSVLDSFNDKENVASWAAGATAAMVSNGYVNGSNGNLNPTNNITRAEFAVLMNNIVKQYITESGTYEKDDIAEGNILVRANDVTIKGATIKGNLILGSSVEKGGVILSSSKVEGEIINDDANEKVVKKEAAAGGGGGGGGSIGGGTGDSGNTGSDNGEAPGIEDGGEI